MIMRVLHIMLRILHMMLKGNIAHDIVLSVQSSQCFNCPFAEGRGVISFDGHWQKRPPVAFCGAPIVCMAEGALV